MRYFITFFATILCLCTAQALVGSEALKITRTSSDHRFVLLEDDSAWYLLSEEDVPFADIAATEEDLNTLQTDDLITINHSDDPSLYTLHHDANNLDFVALKVDALLHTTVCWKWIDRLINLENDLYIDCPGDVYNAVSEDSPITQAFLNRRVDYQGQSYFFDLQWVTTTNRNWFFQQYQSDAILGRVVETNTHEENTPSNEVTFVSLDHKLITLGNGSTWINVEYSGKNDAEGKSTLEKWNLGDQIEIVQNHDETAQLTNLTMNSTQTFLPSTLSIVSPVKEAELTTSDGRTVCLLVVLENGVTIEPLIQCSEHYKPGSSISFHSLYQTKQLISNNKTVDIIYSMFHQNNDHFEYAMDTIGYHSNFGDITFDAKLRLDTNPPEMN